MDDILHASIAQIAAQIRKRELSPVELIDMTIKAIDQCEPQLNAFITVFREESLEGAKQGRGRNKKRERSRSAARSANRSQGYNLR